ncbi:MAG TPA: secondary thiamine-phosphate synthase enzyme YjbQ [Croceibacterium sp.]|nr:secondary thiamine-phosphate synthase enzyme YjbQ [Croceibacterium sp.]
MRTAQASFIVETPGRGLTEITERIDRWLGDSDIGTGVLHIFCRHTSASLLINENAAAAVQRDLLAWLDRVAPERDNYEHDSEGPDDMPAHIKTLLTGSGLSVPVGAGRMLLGTWQGVFLAEHRRRPHNRTIVLTVIGE